MIRSTFSLLVVVIPILLLSGCSGRSEFPFSRAGMEDTVLREAPSIPAEREGELRRDGDSYRSAFYSLPSPVSVTDGEGFFLTYGTETAIPGLELVLGIEGGRKLRTPLPTAAGTRCRIYVPLTGPGGERAVSGFALESPEAGRVRIERAGIVDRPPLFSLRGDFLTLHAGVGARTEPSNGIVEVTVPESGRSGDTEGSWLLTIAIAADTAGDDDARTDLLISGRGGENARLRLRLSPSEQTVPFTRGVLGFAPSAVRLESLPRSSEVSVDMQPDAVPQPSSWDRIVPVPAAPSSILDYEPDSFRRKEFELFSWHLYPEVLIFDFADEDIQAKFFGRLGFFVAVKGESGRIEPEEYYRGRHVYNAHDYRPEDLARFFSTAASGGTALNREEKMLRDLCLARGILEQDGNTYRPGSGAVLSVSRSIWKGLRKRLLAHESLHGLFYVVPAFREGAIELWRAMDGTERAFWLGFLAYKGRMDGRDGYDGYDPENEYLMVNEMQAHMLQLERHEVDAYFRGHYLNRLVSVVPEYAPLRDRLLRERPDMFRERRDALERLLQQTTGLKGGSIYSAARLD